MQLFYKYFIKGLVGGAITNYLLMENSDIFIMENSDNFELE